MPSPGQMSSVHCHFRYTEDDASLDYQVPDTPLMFDYPCRPSDDGNEIFEAATATTGVHNRVPDLPHPFVHPLVPLPIPPTPGTGITHHNYYSAQSHGLTLTKEDKDLIFNEYDPLKMSYLEFTSKVFIALQIKKIIGCSMNEALPLLMLTRPIC